MTKKQSAWWWAGTLLRWMGRLAGLGVAAFVLAFFVGEGAYMKPALLLNLGIWLAFVLPFAGVLLGWRWEVLGGILAVGGIAGFYLWNHAMSGRFPSGPFFLFIASPGFLYLASALVRRLAWPAAKEEPA